MPSSLNVCTLYHLPMWWGSRRNRRRVQRAVVLLCQKNSHQRHKPLHTSQYCRVGRCKNNQCQQPSRAVRHRGLWHFQLNNRWQAPCLGNLREYAIVSWGTDVVAMSSCYRLVYQYTLAKLTTNHAASRHHPILESTMRRNIATKNAMEMAR